MEQERRIVKNASREEVNRGFKDLAGHLCGTQMSQ